MFKHRLPPLDPLIAFEAAARLLSFTRAGKELHLTQAAISQQIRNLEQSLQVNLFTRSHRAVQLTNEGRELQHTVSTILRQLAGATMDIKNVEFTEELIIGCDQSFATYWLGPNLPSLRVSLPDVTLRLIATDEENASLGGETQISILHGDGNWPGYQTHQLFDEEVFPVCSPDFSLTGAEENWVDWLLQAPLIDLADSHWNWMNWRLLKAVPTILRKVRWTSDMPGGSCGRTCRSGFIPVNPIFQPCSLFPMVQEKPSNIRTGSCLSQSHRNNSRMPWIISATCCSPKILRCVRVFIGVCNPGATTRDVL